MYKLLVVEDEEAIRRGLIEQIHWEDYGFSVAGEATNGSDALDLIPKLQPDAMLVDIMMPVMTGLELLSHASRRYPRIKSVVLSGYSEFEYARKGLEYGVFSYILKPTKDDEISRVFLGLKASLDRITSGNQQYERIARKAREGEPFLLEHLLKRLIASEGTTAEWQEAIDLGLIPTEACLYGVAILQANDADEAERFSFSHLNKSAVLASWIRQYACGTDGMPLICPLFNDDGTLTLLYFAPDKEEACARDLLTRFSRWLEEVVRHSFSVIVTVTAGLGNLHNGMGGFAQSCIEAREALEYRFFQGLGNVILYDACRTGNGKYAEALERFNKFDIGGRIVHNTMIGRIDMALEAVDRFGELIADLRSGDQELVLLKVMEILLLFSKRLSEMGLDAASIYSRNTHQTVRRIISEKALEHLLIKLKGICLQVIKSIYGETKTNSFDPMMEKAKQYIKENYDKKISLDDMCKLTYLSASHFCSLFKQYTGSTFVTYLSHMRIAKAKELLAESNFKVYEVAVMMGYDDFRHFSKMFKKAEGINPRQYREKLSGAKQESV